MICIKVISRNHNSHIKNIKNLCNSNNLIHLLFKKHFESHFYFILDALG